MLNLCFLRHGQSEASRDRRFAGSIDAPLTSIGHEMAEAFAESYASVEWSAIYSSPMRRALDTAGPLARKRGVAVEVVDDLREVAYGDWEGILEDEVRRRWPREYSWWAADPATRSSPGGESGLDVAARALRSLDRIRTTHETGRVLVVSHKTTLRIIVCLLLGIDVRRYRDRIAQSVASLTEFQLDGANVLLKRLGDVAHLPPRLRDLPGA